MCISLALLQVFDYMFYGKRESNAGAMVKRESIVLPKTLSYRWCWLQSADKVGQKLSKCF